MPRKKLWMRWPFVMAAMLLVALMAPIAAAQPPETRESVVETQKVGLAYYQDRIANEGFVINRTGPRSMSLLLPAVQFRMDSLDSDGADSDVWDALIPTDGQQRMRLDLQISKRVDKTTPSRVGSFFDEADAIFGKRVAVSGRTQAQFKAISGLEWRARIDGEGRCLDDKCLRMELNLEMVGRLKRGVDGLANAFVGDMSLRATAIFDREESGELTFEPATTPDDNTVTIPGEEDAEHDVNAVGDMRIRVMPGDNVQ